MIELVTWALHGAREQTLGLATGIPSHQACSQAVPGEHHPVWILGHLLLGDTYLLSLLGVADIPPDFQLLLEHYGPGASPRPSPDGYDSLASLLERLVDSGVRRQAAVGRMSAVGLNGPTPDPVLARAQPTIGHHLQALVCHEGYHAGQLAAWRRRHGFPPVPWALATPMS